MGLDAALSIAHHLAVYSLIVVLVMEIVLVGQMPGVARIERLARVDGLYGLAAIAVIAAGIARVRYGAKGSDFYVENPVFWLKMTLFVLMGLLSIMPTVTFLRWRRAVRQDPGFVPSAESVRRIKLWLHFEASCLLFIPVCAALMARGIGLGWWR